MKKSFQQIGSGAAKQGASPANVYENRAGRPITLIIAPSTTDSLQKNNQEKLTNDSEDIESYKNRYGFELIAEHGVPYIIRVINGEHLKFVSVRMAETQLLRRYLSSLHSNIFSCTSVRSYFITEAEAKLLNEINQTHNENKFGKELFFARQDYIVRLEDVIEFHTFVDVCYTKLLGEFSSYGREKCGYIRINSRSVVPYCFKDNHQYVPLFYFEGDTENLERQAVKLENWNLAYLKFCCKVLGIRNELFDTDSISVTTLDNIKNHFPTNTHFEEYWPAKVNSQLLTNQKSTHVNSPGAWIRTPPEVVPAESSLRHALTATTSVVPPSMPAMVNVHQNARPAIQMIIHNQAQPPSTTRAYYISSRKQSIAAQSYNTVPVMPQNSSPINSVGRVVPLPPPLARISNTAPVIGKTVSYSNIGPISQNGMTTIYNPLTNSNGSNVMSHSSQVRQFYTQSTSNNSQAQQPQQQQQQLIIRPNAMKNIVNAPITDIIDLSSPPSTPPLPTVPETTLRPVFVFEVTKIAELTWTHDTSNNAAYQVKKSMLLGQLINCINSKPYIYSDFMVIIDDVVQIVLPSCTAGRCAYILYKYLKVVLYSGNSEQMAVLRKNGCLRSLSPELTLMAMLTDIVQAVPQLNALVAKQDATIQPYQPSCGSSKRKHMS